MQTGRALAGSEAPKLSVLMPVYNEARTLRTIVPRVLASPIDLEIELVAVDLNAKLGRADLSPRQMRWFDRLLPLFKVLERPARGLGLPGLSLIAVGRKQARLHGDRTPETARAAAPVSIG